MKLSTIFVAILLTLFATAVMSYISMATPIGPWIEATLVLCSMIIFTFIRKSKQEYTESLGLTTAAGGIGGILATACGFSVPTLYFIAPDIFNSWMAQPLYFSLILTSLAIAAGSFGLVIAGLFEKELLVNQNMPFPIGELVYKIISGADQLKKAISLALGFISTLIFLYAQTCIQFLATHFTLVNKMQLGIITVPRIVIPLDWVPMFWSIGFVTGHVIAVPLIVGFLAKILCMEPLYYIYPIPMSIEDFSTAFCSGIVLSTALSGLIQLPKFLTQWIRTITQVFLSRQKQSEYSLVNTLNVWTILELLGVIIFTVAFFWYFNFSLISQLYILLFTFICTYQMLIIAGKIGLAPLGRFATFVMVPGMFLFGFNSIQVVFVAAFVEIAGGVACDVLFGRKMASLAELERKKIIFYQWLGLLVSAACVGILFWLLITTFGLGSQVGNLAVNKALSRALLINIKSFDIIVLSLGFMFGYILKYSSINPVLVLGGLLMPPYMSLLLVLGGLSTYLTNNKEEYYPLWSGVFAANSLWMIIKALFKASCT